MKNVARTKVVPVEGTEALQQRVAENAPIIVWDIEQRITLFNKAFEQLTGYMSGEIVGQPLSMLFPEASRDESQTKIRQALSGERWESVEIPILRKDGEVLIALWNSANIYDKDGKALLATIAQGQDITERKQIREKLEHLNKVLRAIRSVNQLITKENDRDRLLKGACDSLIETRGYYSAWVALLDESGRLETAAEAGLGEDFLPLVERLRRGEFSGCGQKALLQSGVIVTADPASTCTDCPLSAKYGGWGAMTTRLEYGGRVYGLMSLSVPAHLIANKEEQSLFEEVAGDIAFALHGMELEEERQRVKEKLQGKNEQLEVRNEELRAVNEELQAAEEELRASNRELQAANEGLEREITERERAEQKIKRVAGEWRTTFDAITDLVSIHDRDFRLIRVNRAFADAFGVKPKELIGKTCYKVVHGADGPVPDCPHRKALKTREPATGEYFEPRLGIHLEVTASPLLDDKGEVAASVHVARDITERKAMDEQLIIADRLASVGELASGIAHELNNPLTSVIGFSHLLLDKDIPDDIKEDVKIISSEAQRAAGVVKNLLTFARKHASVKQLVNVNEVVEKVLELRDYEQKVSNIRTDTRFAADLPEVMADYFQLQQVFLNIIINAEHFMIEAHNRGNLTIVTERANNMVRASFIDDGPGVPPENLRRLFDPFFTTKEVGDGTGLGLSICHGIITEHGGRIYVESEPGRGATFTVELPVSASDREEG